MPIDDLRCEKCGAPVRHSYSGTRGWICSVPTCMTNRWLARDGSESDMWDEILPVLHLHFPGEEVSQKLLEKLWAKLDRERDDGPPDNEGDP